MSVAKSGLKTWLRVEGMISEEIKERGMFLAGTLRSAIDKSSTQLKDELRSQVRRAGLGERLEKAWQRAIYPKNAGKMTFGPAAVVYSKSTILHRAFNENRTISARRAEYLVIALPAAIHLGLGYSTISRNGTKVPAGQRRKVSEIDAAAKKLRAVVVSAHNTKRGPRMARAKPKGRNAPIEGRRIVIMKARKGDGLTAVFYEPKMARGLPLFALRKQVQGKKLLNIEPAFAAAQRNVLREVNMALQKQKPAWMTWAENYR